MKICNKKMLSQILNTCYEMFECRGYEIVSSTLNSISATFENKNIYLVLLDDVKLNIDIIRQYYGHCIKNNIQHLILVYDDVMTSSVKKVLQKVNITIETFRRKELIYNITKHTLVPKHERVDKSNITCLNNYPTILKSDPVVRFYNFQYGDVIKIHRSDNSIYFRVVR